MEDLKNQIETKENLIKALQESIKLKEDQIKTLMESLALKDEQIGTLQLSLITKDEKVETLEKSLETKTKEMEECTSSLIDESVLIQKQKTIEELNAKIDILNDELLKSDEEIEKLELENQSLKAQETKPMDSKIMDFTQYSIAQSEILFDMKKIIDESVHKVIIATPSIQDLQELFLYEIKSSVSMNISCYINQNDPEDMELLEEFESLDNITIRHFEDKDRYVVLRDSEELLFGIIGEKDTNVLIFHTQDAKHVKILNSIGIDAWLRSKKIIY